MAWNSTGTWSLSSNGTPSGLVPQANDTIIIDRVVVQNVNFTFNEKGSLNVLSTGVLRGENLDLYFRGNSVLKSNGEVKLKSIYFSDNSSLFIDTKGIVSVMETFSNSSPGNHIVNGKLSSAGITFLSDYVKITGVGSLFAAGFDGNGSAFSINNLSIIPANSVITSVNWTGNKNNDWNDAANWTGGNVPTTVSNVAVLAASNPPVITTESNCNNLVINAYAALNIAPNGCLIVNGSLTVVDGGTLLLKNTNEQKASLILKGNVSGKIKSEYPVIAGRSQLISAPVKNSPSGVFINMYLRTYNESASQWGEYIVPTNIVLQEMKGYELYALSSQVRLFEGVPNIETKSIPVTNSGNGMNLAGNPFPCYIDWEDGENDAWQRNSVGSAIYYPDPFGSGNYAVYLPGGDDAISLNNGSRYIAPMQGFFVKAEKEGVLTVNSDSRITKVDSGQTSLKNTSIKLKLSKNAENCDEIIMRVNPNSTFGFDPYFDAVKLPGNTGSSWLYMTSNDETHYSVNSIPTINSSMSIPVGMNCSQSGSFTLSFSGANNFEYRYPVYLKDKILNTYVDLRQDSSYTFFQSADMNKDRFEIFFNSPLNIDNLEIDNLKVIVFQGSIEIKGMENVFFNAGLYSLEGKMISSEQGVLTEGIRLAISNYTAGVYLLKLSNGNKIITKKVFLR